MIFNAELFEVTKKNPNNKNPLNGYADARQRLLHLSLPFLLYSSSFPPPLRLQRLVALSLHHPFRLPAGLPGWWPGQQPGAVGLSGPGGQEKDEGWRQRWLRLIASQEAEWWEPIRRTKELLGLLLFLLLLLLLLQLLRLSSQRPHWPSSAFMPSDQLSDR